MPVASHSEADRGDSKWAKYPRQDHKKRLCQPLYYGVYNYFILDNPERGLNMLNTGIVL